MTQESFYKKFKWEVIAKDYNSPFYRNYVWTTFPAKQAKEFKVPPFIAGIVSRKDSVEYVADMNAFANIHNALKKQLDKDSLFLEKVIDKTVKLGDEFNKWSEENVFKANLSKLEASELMNLLKEFSKRQTMMYSYGGVLPLLDLVHGASFIESTITKFLKSKTSDKDFQKYYSVFTEPIHNSYAQEQEEDLLKLMSRFYNDKWIEDVKNNNDLEKNHPEFYKQLQKHTAKYAWVYYVYKGPAFTEDDFLRFIIDYLYDGIKPTEKLKEFEERRKEIETLKKKYLEELNPDDFNRMMLEFAGKIVWSKSRRKDQQSKSYYHMGAFHREISKRLNISLQQARSTPFDMIEKGLNGEKIDTKVADSIYESHVCLPTEDGEVLIFHGKKAEEFHNLVVKEKENDEARGEVKGMCAYPGRIKGIVKIVNKPSDMNKLKEGDILISTATTPSIIFAMKKASAFVTDEGGITCHAAIVSREMQKPCVVGTKNATTVFKDGDTVEIDAEKGVVRKL